MRRLAGVLMRRRRLVLCLWAVALLAAAPLAVKQTTHLTGGGFTDGSSASAQVERELARFPGSYQATLVVILKPTPSATSADLMNAIGVTAARVSKIDGAHVDQESLSVARSRARAGREHTVLIELGIRNGGEGKAIDVANKLRTAFGITETRAGTAGLSHTEAYIGGQGALWAAIQASTKRDVELSEARAFPLIALVLLVVFGSMAAAVLPSSLGAAAVVLSGALVYALSLAAETSVTVTTVASMLGLGIAVDYSLFILVRYREEIAAGADAEQAIASTLSTSGVAVVTSGVTVIAALVALLLLNSTALRSIAVGAMLVVAVSVLVASTLLPVLIRSLGARAHQPGRLGAILHRRAAGPRQAFWLRWSSGVMRRPFASVVAAVVLLLVLSIPTLSMRIENTGLRQVAANDSFRKGLASAREIVGPGGLGPVQIAVARSGAQANTPIPGATLSRVDEAIWRDRAVLHVTDPKIGTNGRTALFVATLDTEPTSQKARAAVARIRARLAHAQLADIVITVGGTTAAVVDFDHLIGSSLWKLALVVLVLSYLVLVPLLRSVVLPLKAVLMTMLSVICGFGVVVAIFQWGWLSFLGLDRAPAIDTDTPPLVIVIAFGLSMDYEVFMLSRIRERFLATGDTRRAVLEGLSSTARTITSAALIMVIVFLAFVTAGLPSVQRLGVACAATIAIDATLVRLVLVPGLMVLFGRWNWWMPGPLERLLPGSGRQKYGPGVAATLDLPPREQTIVEAGAGD
jgi:RND superfamily putative drug exporter